MRSHVSKTLAVLSLALLVAAGSTACSEGSVDSVPDAQATSPSAADSSAQTPVSDLVVIDVRSPQEFAEGHVQGALNLDLNSGEFQAAMDGLDPDANYALYCRSGNRSGQAAAMLAGAGFTSVQDLGPLQDAADALGLPVTQ